MAKKKPKPRRAVVAPSGPWKVLNRQQLPIADTDTNFRRQLCGVRACQEFDAELLIVSGRSEETDMLELEALRARREAQWRPERTIIQRGAYCTFLNAYFSLEIAWQMGIDELYLVSNDFHSKRLLYTFEGILGLSERRLGWRIPTRFVACPTSENPAVILFEEQLELQEEAKLGMEQQTLAGYAEDLLRWRRRKGRTVFLPFPKVVEQVVPPPTLARIASERRILE